MTVTAGPRGTIYAVVRTGHHVRLLADAMGALQARGHRVQFAHFKNNPGAEGAVAQLRKEGFKPVLALRVLEDAAPGDTVVYAVKGGLTGPRGIDGMAARGVRFAHVCEGCRFVRRAKYHPTLPIPFLGWGPSAAKTGLADVRIVGAPFMERMDPAQPGTGIALINYKFTYREARLDPEGDWARAAVLAAEQAGLRPLVSAHPSATPPAGLPMAEGPSSELLPKAEVLISRASTLIYEALMIGVQPFYLTVRGDNLKEFARPRNAYPICDNAETLGTEIAAWRQDKTRFDGGAFLNRHVSRDPNRPAGLRMADEIEAIHLGPPLVAAAPAIVP